MKKIAVVISLIIYSFLLSSCYIYLNNEDDYAEYENCKFYKTYESMRKHTITEINEAFTDYHWNEKRFDEKYNDDSFVYLAFKKDLENLKGEFSEYKYCVRTGNTLSSSENLLKPEPEPVTEPETPETPTVEPENPPVNPQTPENVETDNEDNPGDEPNSDGGEDAGEGNTDEGGTNSDGDEVSGEKNPGESETNPGSENQTEQQKQPQGKYIPGKYFLITQYDNGKQKSVVFYK